MSRPEPNTHAEMHARYIESRRRLGIGASVETPRARLAPLLRSEPSEQPPPPRDDLRPAEIEALADALMRRMHEDDDGDVARLPRPLMLADIVAAVARRHGMSSRDLMSERRTAPVVKARQRAVWLCRRMTLRALPAIGRAVRRDHTTVIHSIRAVEADLERDPALEAELASIEAELRARFEPPLQHPDGCPGTGAA